MNAREVTAAGASAGNYDRLHRFMCSNSLYTCLNLNLSASHIESKSLGIGVFSVCIMILENLIFAIINGAKP
jgi:hypothetical protein